MKRAIEKSDPTPEKEGPVMCYVCGNDTCCDPSHASIPVQRTFTCTVCGKSVTLDPTSPLPPVCCNRNMNPHPGGSW